MDKRTAKILSKATSIDDLFKPKETHTDAAKVIDKLVEVKGKITDIIVIAVTDDAHYDYYNTEMPLSKLIGLLEMAKHAVITDTESEDD